MSHSYATPGLARQQLLHRRAHAMRFHPTPPEALLWRYLRARQLGVSFRRQVVLGDAIVDFFASQARLIVEVDGDAYHGTRTAADAAREQRLRRAGYRVLRLSAALVLGQPAKAVRRVVAELRLARPG